VSEEFYAAEAIADQILDEIASVRSLSMDNTAETRDKHGCKEPTSWADVIRGQRLVKLPVQRASLSLRNGRNSNHSVWE
jgi:hypothetical protein